MQLPHGGTISAQLKQENCVMPRPRSAVRYRFGGASPSQKEASRLPTLITERSLWHLLLVDHQERTAPEKIEIENSPGKVHKPKPDECLSYPK